jgi:hypothetical protein
VSSLADIGHGPILKLLSHKQNSAIDCDLPKTKRPFALSGRGKLKKIEMIQRVVSECGAWRIENMKEIK